MQNSESAQTTPSFRDRRPDALGNLTVFPDELLCSILEFLDPPDVARLACVSSVMYILCNEEPLWMSLCLKKAKGQLQYKGSWKKTTLFIENVQVEEEAPCRKPLQFDGFSSMFLYRRLYRCHTTLNGFSFDSGNVEKRQNLTLEEFRDSYDAKKPVLLGGLSDDWPARHTWTTDQLSVNYGDTEFRISQRSSHKVTVKFKDYVSYMDHQHDEDPLYIFDDKFGDVAPGLLKDYSVPHLFQEDFFDILEDDQRPSYRWLIVGPERSGASWHVDPALTSAWNTLLCGRKRWALYPPGRVPLGVSVHVNEDDGDVSIDTPSSLQWWLDFYPLLADEDKPLECTQLPGETIYVPSGWWHCVLNLEATVAVTQNFVNSENFEYVCLDMAPGYRHKGVSRAGLLALDEDSCDDDKMSTAYEKNTVRYSDLTRKEKRVKFHVSEDSSTNRCTQHTPSKHYNSRKGDFIYDINFLSMFLDEDRDHYNFPWSPGNCIGPREMRNWLSKLWVAKPELRGLIWKGACIALNAGKWSECLKAICAHHNIFIPTNDERLPVGTGSNPVYLMDDCVIKIFVEEGLEASLYGLGTELEFYNLLSEVNSPLKKHIPDVLDCGILHIKNGSYAIEPWNGREVPDIVSKCNIIPKCCKDSSPFDVWSKKAYECRKVGKPIYESTSCTKIWPYIIMKRCKGSIYAELRDALTWEDTLDLASFLGEQLRNLHLLPLPPFKTPSLPMTEMAVDCPSTNGCMENLHGKPSVPVEWDLFVSSLFLKKKDVSSRLTNWGYPIPRALIAKVDEYIPDDLAGLIKYKDESGIEMVYKNCTWLHSDIMDDNVHLEPWSYDSSLSGDAGENGHGANGERKLWRPSHILDFSNLSTGDPILDLIPIHLDIFRGDPHLLKQLLGSYKLPLMRNASLPVSHESDSKFKRLSFHVMCYCILHEENVLGAIFSIWRELRDATSWEEVEQTVWGELNNYRSFS